MSKKYIEKYIIDEYGVTSPIDITIKTNYRNGYSKKTVKTSHGGIKMDIPLDRNGSFEPTVIEKHQCDISDVDHKIINLYARGMSTHDISDTI